MIDLLGLHHAGSGRALLGGEVTSDSNRKVRQQIHLKGGKPFAVGPSYLLL